MNIDAINAMIGQPWVYGENDCLAVVKKALKSVFNVTIYDIEIPEKSDLAGNARLFKLHSQDNRWLLTENPSGGCAVLFKNRRGNALHFGLYIENNNVLHCPGTVNKPGSVMYENIKTLRLQFPIIEFYEYNDCK